MNELRRALLFRQRGVNKGYRRVILWILDGATEESRDFQDKLCDQWKCETSVGIDGYTRSQRRQSSIVSFLRAEWRSILQTRNGFLSVEKKIVRGRTPRSNLVGGVGMSVVIPCRRRRRPQAIFQCIIFGRLEYEDIEDSVDSVPARFQGKTFRATERKGE